MTGGQTASECRCSACGYFNMNQHEFFPLFISVWFDLHFCDGLVWFLTLQVHVLAAVDALWQWCSNVGVKLKTVNDAKLKRLLLTQHHGNITLSPPIFCLKFLHTCGQMNGSGGSACTTGCGDGDTEYAWTTDISEFSTYPNFSQNKNQSLRQRQREKTIHPCRLLPREEEESEWGV